MRKWIIALIVVVVIGGVAAFDYGSPWWALRNIQAAAQANDSDTIAGHVNFEALRADLKQELRGRMDAEGGDSIAAAMGDAFIDPLVDAVVTPRGIRTVFDARGSAAGGGGVLSLPRISGDPVVARTGINSFTVSASDGCGSLVFTRAFPFMSWRLSGIDLPADQAAPEPTAAAPAS